MRTLTIGIALGITLGLTSAAAHAQTWRPPPTPSAARPSGARATSGAPAIT